MSEPETHGDCGGRISANELQKLLHKVENEVDELLKELG
jgi:hypothetical protein